MVNPARTMMIPVLLGTGGSSISGFFTAGRATPRPASAPSRLERPAASIEAGRWIVSEAGITLYRVEVVKEPYLNPNEMTFIANGLLPCPPSPNIFSIT